MTQGIQKYVKCGFRGSKLVTYFKIVAVCLFVCFVYFEFIVRRKLSLFEIAFLYTSLIA